MTLGEFQDNLEAYAYEIINDRVNFVLSLASDHIALNARRVQNKGIKEDGAPFKVPYSPEHEKARKDKGLPINYKNLTFTGNMFKSIKPTIVENTLDKTVAEIKAGDKGNQAKINENSAREKTNILALSEKESTFITGRTIKWLTELKAKHGLNE